MIIKLFHYHAWSSGHFLLSSSSSIHLSLSLSLFAHKCNVKSFNDDANFEITTTTVLFGRRGGPAKSTAAFFIFIYEFTYKKMLLITLLFYYYKCDLPSFIILKSSGPHGSHLSMLKKIVQKQRPLIFHLIVLRN